MRIHGRILMNQAGGDKPGGGGGAGSGDTQAAMLEAIGKLTAMFSELPKQLEAATNRAVHGAFKKTTKTEPPAPKIEAGGDGDDDLSADEQPPAGEGKAAKPAAGDSPEAKALRKMQRELAALKAENAAKDTAAKARKAASEAAEDRARLQAVLSGKVRPELLEAAVALHYDGKKRIRRERASDDDDGTPMWVDGEDSLPIEEGVAKWLGSAEGKAYVPPVPAGGSGNRGGQIDKATGKPAVSLGDLGNAILGVTR